MTYAQETLPALHVIGLSCETNHLRASADIGALWARAAEAGLLAGSPEAYAVYHRYKVTNGGYEVTVTVGRRASPNEAPGEGQTLVAVPEQRCMHVVTDGSIPAVQRAWSDMWSRWPDGGPRAFLADAERWEMGPSGVPARADVYVGMRE
jgi:predicted transcriptional regulator YdeE